MRKTSLLTLSIITSIIVVTPLGYQARAQDEQSEVPSCSSYKAVYRPHTRYEDSDRYEMTIYQVVPDGSYLQAYDVLKISKYDENHKILYELELGYDCSEGSAHSCSISAAADKGQPIDIVPQALRRDFSPADFIANDKDVERGETSPYAIIFPNASSEFYYKGRHISSSNVKFLQKAAPAITSVPGVWLLQKCIN